MKTKNILITVFAIIVVIGLQTRSAYAEKYLVIFDSSDGMSREVSGERLIYAASKEVVKFADQINSDSKVGVMVFGHTDNGCEDAEIKVPFDKPDPEKIKTALAQLTPTGRRGLIFALGKAINIFSEDKESGVIILVTSGWDECGGRAFEIEDILNESKPKVMIVIIAISPETRDADNLKDLAQASRGNYQEVENIQSLGSLLGETAKGTNASLQVIIHGGDPEVPNAQLRIFDDKSQMILSQTISGFFSTDLNTGTYDIQLIYQGKNFWQRQVFIRKDQQMQVEFDLDAAMGDLKLEILDQNGERVKGNVVISDSLGIVAFEGKGQSQYVVTLPQGIYSAEVTVGDQVETADGLDVLDEGTAYYPVTISLQVGTAEIVVNNGDGVPVNAAIVVQDSSGAEVAKSDFTSTFLVTLPPGDYTAIVTTSNEQQETQPFTITEGDNITVDVNVEAPMGSILIELVDENGEAVYGNIKIYDERGHIIPYFEREAVEDSEFAFDLPVGTYRVEAESDSRIQTVDGVTISEGEEKIVMITFPNEEQ